MSLIENIRQMGKNVAPDAKSPREATEKFGKMCMNVFSDSYKNPEEVPLTKNGTDVNSKVLGIALSGSIAASVAGMFLGVTNPNNNIAIQMLTSQIELVKQMAQMTPGAGIAASGMIAAGAIGATLAYETQRIAGAAVKTIKTAVETLKPTTPKKSGDGIEM